MKLLSVFPDSSIVLSGLASSQGGSGRILELSRRKKIHLLVTDLVIEEVAAHLGKVGVPPAALRDSIVRGTLWVIKSPPPELILRFSSLTLDPNDAHVLAGAVLSGADFLISLDKKHILTRKVKRFLRPIKVFSPKQFFRHLDRSQSPV